MPKFKNKKTGEEIEAILKQNPFDLDGKNLILSWTEPMKLDADWVSLEDEYFDDMEDFNRQYQEINNNSGE